MRRGVRRTGWCETKLTYSAELFSLHPFVPSSGRRGITCNFLFYKHENI